MIKYKNFYLKHIDYTFSLSIFLVLTTKASLVTLDNTPCYVSTFPISCSNIVLVV